MKLLLLLSALLAAQFVMAQTSEEKFPLTVQVTASRLDHVCVGGGNVGSPSCSVILHISAVIDGRHCELDDRDTKPERHQPILIPGTYKASLIRDEQSAPYLLYRVYKLQYPNGKTEQFTLIGESTP